MRAGSALAAAMLLAGGCTTHPAPSDAPDWPEGVYGNVNDLMPSDHLGGFEARFFTEDGLRMVEYVFCEGWCNRSYRSEVTRRDGGFGFLEPATSPANGMGGSGASESNDIEYRVRRSGAGLEVRRFDNGRESFWAGKPMKIKPLPEPYGLAVANAAE
jgi:hypothetical protein